MNSGASSNPIGRPFSNRPRYPLSDRNAGPRSVLDIVQNNPIQTSPPSVRIIWSGLTVCRGCEQSAESGDRRLMNRSRHILAVLAVTAALCADQLASAAPLPKAPVVEIAARL